MCCMTDGDPWPVLLTGPSYFLFFEFCLLETSLQFSLLVLMLLVSPVFLNRESYGRVDLLKFYMATPL